MLSKHIHSRLLHVRRFLRVTVGEYAKMFVFYGATSVGIRCDSLVVTFDTYLIYLFSTISSPHCTSCWTRRLIFSCMKSFLLERLFVPKSEKSRHTVIIYSTIHFIHINPTRPESALRQMQKTRFFCWSCGVRTSICRRPERARLWCENV